MSLRYLIVVLILLSVPFTVLGQNRYDGIALGPRGPVAGASIAVCTQPAVTTTAPCSPLATLYTDSTLTTISVNPLLADQLGNFHFYIAAGFYTVQIYGPGISPPTVLKDQAVLASIGSVTDVTVTNNVSSLLTISVATPTSTPDIIFGYATAPANNVFGNCTTSPAAPAYCFITGTMLPFPGASSLGGVQSITCPAHEWIDEISTTGTEVCTQPTAGDISGLNFSRISTGSTTSVCSTTNVAGNTCTTTVPISPTQADTSYIPICMGTGAVQFPFVLGTTTQTTSSITVEITNGQGNQAQVSTFASLGCVAVHP